MRRDVAVVGASAGGVEALRALVAGLPPDYPGAVFVVLHMAPGSTSALPTILSRAGPLPAVHAEDGERVEPGRIYVARPNLHLLVDDSRVRLHGGPRENGSRPAVDPLFRSAARAYGDRVAGVVLSGVLDDGTNGLAAVKAAGGVAIVQEDAMFPGMPKSAAARVPIDHAIPAALIGPLLGELAENSHKPRARGGRIVGGEELKGRDQVVEAQKQDGLASGLTCPDCNGSIWELHDGDAVWYECRVGHSYSVETMLAAQSEHLEGALWAALNALEERAALLRRVASQGGAQVGQRMGELAADAEAQARVLRQALLGAIRATADGET